MEQKRKSIKEPAHNILNRNLTAYGYLKKPRFTPLFAM